MAWNMPNILCETMGRLGQKVQFSHPQPTKLTALNGDEASQSASRVQDRTIKLRVFIYTQAGDVVNDECSILIGTMMIRYGFMTPL